MYIYDLPYEINKELCRLLDNDDDWKELADHMQYTAFDVNEIEQTARRQEASPTAQLLTQWAQLNHRAEELFMLLYRMRHVPALRCLAPLLPRRFQRLLQKRAPALGGAGRGCGGESSLPLPVVLIDERAPAADEPAAAADSGRSRAPRRLGAADAELLRSASAVPHVPYDELRCATADWAPRNLLGRGGFGQVFKGEWKMLPVAVKRLSSNDAENKELIREMCLNQYRHDNILPLYGYSLGGAEACLVYQLMAGGSLEQRLRARGARAPLSWAQRRRALFGAARGLLYLHSASGAPLIHGDVKPANILLDDCGAAKIGDFGLARRGTDLQVSRVHGTRPYLPDEYLRWRLLSPAVDVYSFGVVLVETATALPASDRGRAEPLLAHLVQRMAREGLDFGTLEDPALRLAGAPDPALCRALVALGAQCAAPARADRPSMLHVFRALDALGAPEL